MNEIAINRGLLPVTEQRAKILQSDFVLERLASKELKIAKMGIQKAVREIPDKVTENGRENGLVFNLGIIAKGICKDYSIRTVEDSQVYKFYSTIRDYYEYLTLNEVRVAFDLALVGELDPYLPTDSKGNPDKSAYQEFSQEFICKILNAYKKYRGKIWSKVHALEQKQPKEVSEDEKKEHFEGFKEVLRGQYEDWLKGEVPVFMFSSFVARYLIGLGIVNNRQISPVDRIKAYQLLMTSTKEEKQREGLKNALKGIGENESLDNLAERLKNEALILEAFERIRNEKIDF